jgi:hypothetical protein
MIQEPQPLVAAPAGKKTDRSGLVLMLAAFVAIGGITFALGRATAPASAATGQAGTRGALPGASFDPNASFDPATMGRPGGGTMTVTGTVSAVSGSTLTITTSDGRTVAVDASGATWHAQAAATASDVVTGTTVQVSTAGAGGFGPGGAGAPGAPGASAEPAASTATTTVTATDVTIVTP